MQQAARLGDMHECADSGEYPSADLKIQVGSSNIFINGRPAARVGDKLTCKVEQSPVIAKGSSTVFFNGKSAARMHDSIQKGGSIKEGSTNVLIGDGSCLIKFGNGTQIKLGDNCNIKLSCSTSALAVSTDTAAPTSSLIAEPSLAEEGTSLGLDLTPGIGSLKSLMQLITGKDAVTGEPVNRGVELVGIGLGLVPGGKALTKCDRVTNVASKALSEIWKGLKHYRKDIKANGLNGKKTRFFKWDHLHNEIEVYDGNGKHLGAMDPTTGKMIKPAVIGRDITREIN